MQGLLDLPQHYVCSECGCVEQTKLASNTITSSNIIDFNKPNLLITEMLGTGPFGPIDVHMLCCECNTGLHHNVSSKRLATPDELTISNHSAGNFLELLDHPVNLFNDDGSLNVDYIRFENEVRVFTNNEVVNLMYNMYKQNPGNFNMPLVQKNNQELTYASVDMINLELLVHNHECGKPEQFSSLNTILTTCETIGINVADVLDDTGIIMINGKVHKGAGGLQDVIIGRAANEPLPQNETEKMLILNVAECKREYKRSKKDSSCDNTQALRIKYDEAKTMLNAHYHETIDDVTDDIDIQKGN